MRMHVSNAKGRAFEGQVDQGSGEIVVRLDNAGFIVHASENAKALGIDLSTLLLMPHVSDFAEIDHAPDVARYVADVLGGSANAGSIEFPVLVCSEAACEQVSCETGDCEHWYDLSVRLIDDDDGVPQGGLGVLHSVQHKYALDGEPNAHVLTDPVTGLANRHTFCATMRRAMAKDEPHILATFALDRMRALFMQYGQQTTDEILWGFARFLETMALPGHEVGQLDGERFGVLIPGMSMREAREWANELLSTFSGLALCASTRAPELTASAGLARAEMTIDWTLRQAELGLVMARAGGGMQTGVCQPSTPVASGADVERAMEAAVQRAVQRYG